MTCEQRFWFRHPETKDYVVGILKDGQWRYEDVGGYWYSIPPEIVSVIELNPFNLELFQPIGTAPKKGYFWALLLDTFWTKPDKEPVYAIKQCSFNGDKLDIWYLEPKHGLKADECAADGSILTHKLPHQVGMIGPAAYQFKGWIKESDQKH